MTVAIAVALAAVSEDPGRSAIIIVPAGVIAVIAVRVAPAPTPERKTKRVDKHKPVADEPVADEALIVEKGMVAFKTIFTPIVESPEISRTNHLIAINATDHP